MILDFAKAFDPFFRFPAEVYAGRTAEGTYRDAFPVAVMPGNTTGAAAGSALQNVPGEAYVVLIRRADWRSATRPDLGNTVTTDAYGILTVQACDVTPDFFRLTCTRNTRARR